MHNKTSLLAHNLEMVFCDFIGDLRANLSSYKAEINQFAHSHSIGDKWLCASFPGVGSALLLAMYKPTYSSQTYRPFCMHDHRGYVASKGN